MSITRLPGKSKELERLKSKKALEEFLKNGGKITIEEEGKTTSAATMIRKTLIIWTRIKKLYPVVIYDIDVPSM